MKFLYEEKVYLIPLFLPEVHCPYFASANNEVYSEESITLNILIILIEESDKYHSHELSRFTKLDFRGSLWC